MLKGQAGITILEILVALVIVALLTAIAVPSYSHFVNRARVAKAIGDISGLQIRIERFELSNSRLPANLAELGGDIPVDAWEQPYVYVDLNFGRNKGIARKDGRLVPLNSDYDLYSIGADGKTASALNSSAARDDIVRANNGAFVGLGEDY